MLSSKYKVNILCSLIIAGLTFITIFGWMLYYTGIATKNTDVAIHVLGQPIFSVHGISDGFTIGPEYGILLVPFIVGILSLILLIILSKFTNFLTRSVPQ
jgi:hypothetical protein